MKNFHWVFVTLGVGAMMMVAMTGGGAMLPNVSWGGEDAKGDRVRVVGAPPVEIQVTTAVASHEIIAPTITDTAPAPPAVTNTAPAPPPPPLPAAIVDPPPPPPAAPPPPVKEADVTLDVDPFADAGAASAPAKTAGGSCANQAEIDASFEGLDEALAAINGLDLLKEVCMPVPAQKFDYDPSEEAKAQRLEEKTQDFIKQGLPDAPARLRAQLYERELVSKLARAKHNRKRAIVRLIQEARLKKDAASHDERLMMVKIKQEEVQKQMADSEQQRAESEKEKQADREARDKKVLADRQRVESEKEMMNKIRIEEVARLQKENEERRVEEKQDKKRETAEREARDNKEKESKRQMMEEFQAAMQAQMEDQKRLAREERLQEAQEAKEARARLEEQMGKNKVKLDALA